MEKLCADSDRFQVSTHHSVPNELISQSPNHIWPGKEGKGGMGLMTCAAQKKGVPYINMGQGLLPTSLGPKGWA